MIAPRGRRRPYAPEVMFTAWIVRHSEEHPGWSSGRRYPLPGCSGSERSFEEVAIPLTLNGRAATAEDLRSLALVN
jgi:hypothetical protein